MKEETLYTTGEIAKMAGVTIRTIRYYDSKGIISPSSHSSIGHRRYSNEDFIKLKRVLALKYLGLTLEEVRLTNFYNLDKKALSNSLQLQKSIIQNKIHFMKTILEAIDAAENSIKSDESINLEKTIDIINVLSTEKDLRQKYRDASNLNAEIQLIDRFRLNDIDWYKWVFHQMEVKNQGHILEIGCGNGALWAKNGHELSPSTQVVLTDVYEEMLLEAVKQLTGYKQQFKFEVAQPQKLSYPNESFDVIIANHILFYVKDLEGVLKEISRVLKKGGYFYCSTISNTHMHELEELLNGYHENITLSTSKLTQNFGVDNGESILRKIFKNANKKKFENQLIINDAKGLLNYIYSVPGNILEVLANKKSDFESYIEKQIKRNGSEFVITHSNVLFEVVKE